MSKHIDKGAFQLERIVFFSDAVFAIAITLLVLELKIPDVHVRSNEELNQVILSAFPHFFSFVLSFVVIGIYWVSHHRLFNYVIAYNQRLLWLNLFFLFFIICMPFSSEVYGIYAGLSSAFYLYVSNIFMLAFFNFLTWRYIAKKSLHLSQGLENPRLVLYYQLRAWTAPISFGVGVIISLFSNTGLPALLTGLSPLLIFPLMFLLRQRFKDVAG
jgi:uncharacterized membrane protein